MNNKPTKWELNPQACLRELGRMDTDHNYRSTICGIHRMLWAYLNIDCAGYLPEEAQERVNELLEVAFRYGKRMDYRLKQYHAMTGGVVPDGFTAQSYKPGDERSEQLQMPVEFPPPEPKSKTTKRKGKK